MRSFVLILLILIGCGPSTQELIDQHDWKEWKVEMIKDRTITIGFTKDQVRAAFGRPVSKTRTIISGHSYTTWIYRSQIVTFENGEVSAITDHGL